MLAALLHMTGDIEQRHQLRGDRSAGRIALDLLDQLVQLLYGAQCNGRRDFGAKQHGVAPARYALRKLECGDWILLNY